MKPKESILFRMQDLFTMIHSLTFRIDSNQASIPNSLKADIAAYKGQIHTLRWVLDWDYTTMDDLKARVQTEINKQLFQNLKK